MIAVAGGSGNLGRELVPRLLARGERVRVLTRDPQRARSLLPDQVEFVEADVREPASLEDALASADTVISAITGFGPGASGVASVDWRGNRNLLSAAEAAGARRIVLISMQGAAANHPMELMRMKYRAEQDVRAGRCAWVIVRPCPFFGLWSSIIAGQLQNGRPAIVFGRGDNPISFVAEADVARVVEAAAVDHTLDSQTITVGGAEDLTFDELVARVAGDLGIEPRTRRVPVILLRAAAFLLRPVRRDVAGMLEAGITMAAGDMRGDSSILAMLEAQPQVP